MQFRSNSALVHTAQQNTTITVYVRTVGNDAAQKGGAAE